ncbi:hypothetical protein AMECASPLE_027682 [Ameca splendens]|uniref:Uncharacterized protein n=1 Tax=Ameca splendens TaxID=208324 RepID=A0ABV0Y5K0_9TELE
MSLVLVLDLDQAQALPLLQVQAPVPAPLAVAANQGAVTQEVAQTLAVSQSLTQRNPMRRWNHQIRQTLMEQRSRAAAPPHREKPVEVARASITDASWTPPSGGDPGTSHREEAQGTAQDILEGLCISAALGTPWAPTGGGVCGEGRLTLIMGQRWFGTSC